MGMNTSQGTPTTLVVVEHIEKENLGEREPEGERNSLYLNLAMADRITT